MCYVHHYLFTIEMGDIKFHMIVAEITVISLGVRGEIQCLHYVSSNPVCVLVNLYEVQV